MYCALSYKNHSNDIIFTGATDFRVIMTNPVLFNILHERRLSTVAVVISRFLLMCKRVEEMCVCVRVVKVIHIYNSFRKLIRM